MLSITPVTVADYEWVAVGRDMRSGMKAIIAIHNTTLGPALGGCRMWPYASEEEALKDVLRLARGMTYKAAVAGLPLGGGKAVIIGDSKKDKSEALLRAFGRFVHSLGGMYITAEDVGTCQQDMDLIRQETPHVVGVSPQFVGSGDPSPFTALGVFYGMKAAAEFVWGSTDLKDKVVSVQGVGHVGYNLCKLLHKSGARLVVCDVYPDNAWRAAVDFGAQVVEPGDIYHRKVDIFAPCALGAVVNNSTVNRLKCMVVAGAANNVLAADRHGDVLHKRGILYVPDYVINAGGLINVADELHGYNPERVTARVEGIYHTVREILSRAHKVGRPPFRAAGDLAGERIQQARQKQVVEV
ncbi:MAG: Glu/Leu/Phe/Val dehydrogenase dimerization domain-containing protein [Bacillota bacterium]